MKKQKQVHVLLSLNVSEEAGVYTLTFQDEAHNVYEFTADRESTGMIQDRRWYRGFEFPYTIKKGVGAVAIHRFIGGVDRRYSWDMQFLNGNRSDIRSTNLRSVPRSHSSRKADKNVTRRGVSATNLKQIQVTTDGSYCSHHSFRYTEMVSIKSKTKADAVLVRDFYNWYLEPSMQQYITKPTLPASLETEILAVLPAQVSDIIACRPVAKSTPIKHIYLTNSGPNFRYEYRFWIKGIKYGAYGFPTITAAVQAYNRKVWGLTKNPARLLRLPLAIRLQEKTRIQKLEEVGLFKDGKPVKKCSAVQARELSPFAQHRRGSIC